MSGQCLFSVAVCTYNHADLLEGCLQSLADQTLEKQFYEVIIVNNNSTDDTQRIAESFCAREPNFGIVIEVNQGLSYARNRGWQESKGEYVAYIDDDAKASPEWLKNAYELINSLQPRPLCLGGPIYPFYLTPKPGWFKDAYEMRSWGRDSRWLLEGESFSGSNMIWKKGVLVTLGGFPTDRGVKADRLSLGEETYLFQQIWKAGGKTCFYYATNLVINHLVPSFKMTIHYPVKRAFVWGYQAGYSYQPESYRKLITSLIRSSSELLLGLIKTVGRMKKYERVQQWLIEEGKKSGVKAGYIAGLLRLKITMKQE